MASLIQGYNYDIFISYRQKDNKGDQWVSEFVEALKTELESTFKEEISVYFDINPHDGLLETHDVDESLKEKLKCLIFIPIISRTYCDPKAFAWEHEFKTFVEHASKDEFGLKVKLPNGNVASRVLPIVIYDLDKQDIKLCESVLGGVLRGVEFIYAEPGVNRPLRANELSPHDNLNHTIYHNQVNKVANTIKDVLNSLTKREPSVEEAIPGQAIVDEKISAKKPTKKKTHEVPTVSLLYRLKNLTSFSQSTWRIILLVFIVISAGAYWLGQRNTTPPDKPVLRYNIPLSGSLGRVGRKALTLSRDGEYLVYCMNEELNLIQLNSDVLSKPISGTVNSLGPFFSPDGTWIGFENYQEMKVMKVNLAGGNPITICNLEAGMNQANWYENEIIYADGPAIYRVPDSGGTPELIYPLIKSENDPEIWNPQLLPDKKTLLFSQRLEDGDWSILTWRLGSKESPFVLIEKGRDGRYLNSGNIVYSLNNQLYICKFNPKTNQITSEPSNLITNPVYEYLPFGSAQFDFSENGFLIYYEQQESSFLNLVWVDKSGAVTPITNEAKWYYHTAISSDAQYISATLNDKRNNEIIDTKTGNSWLFAEDAMHPVWSADNSIIYYVSAVTTNTVFKKPLDLSTDPMLLFDIDRANALNISNLSRDGKYLPFSANLGTGYDIGYYDMINNEVEILDHYNTAGRDQYPNISPDGKWLAYESDYGGQAAIYVAPFPGPGQRIRVTSGRSTNDINYPVWAPDMTALYYCTTYPDIELWRINIQASENNFSFEPAQSFFNGGNRFTAYDLDIHPNGDRFLLRQRESGTEEAIEPRIKVIVNWEQELEGN